MNWKTAMASALALATLTACADSGLPPLPTDIEPCFERTVPPPPPGPMTKAAIVGLVGDLKASEAEKARCGRRVVALWKGLE